MESRDRSLIAGGALDRMCGVAGYAVRQGTRMRLAWIAVGCGLLLVAGSRGLGDLNFGADELEFLVDLGLGGIGVCGVAVAVLVSAQLFFDELESGALACAVTRTISRAEYFGGLWVGIVVLLALFLGFLGLGLGAVVAWRAAELGESPCTVASLAAPLVGLWLKGGVVAAMTLFVASYATSALFTSGAGLLLAVAAHGRALVSGSSVEWLVRGCPDLRVFDLEPAARVAWPALLGYWLLLVLAIGSAGAYVFSRREL